MGEEGKDDEEETNEVEERWQEVEAELPGLWTVM